MSRVVKLGIANQDVKLVRGPAQRALSFGHVELAAHETIGPYSIWFMYMGTCHENRKRVSRWIG
jgi:hypothetical protein